MQALPRLRPRSNRARTSTTRKSIILELETTDEEVAAFASLCPGRCHSAFPRSSHEGACANPGAGRIAGARQNHRAAHHGQPAAGEDHRGTAALELGHPAQNW